MFNKECSCLVNIVISILCGVLIGYIFSTGILIGIYNVLWIVFGLASATLFLLFALAMFGRRKMYLYKR